MRLRKIVRSSIGARARYSIATKAGSSTAAAIRPTITTGSLQPEMPPRETPRTSPVSPATNVPVPSRSRPRTVSRPASSRRTAAPQTVPASARGTLNQKTQCQEIDTSAPPSTGPRTSPIAATIVFVPMATPSCSRGKASVTRAEEFAKMSAPPIPCAIRQRISSVPSAAKPAPSEVADATDR